MPYDQLVFRLHAIQRMFDRGISEVEVRDILENGDVIDRDPDSLPYPSYLTLGFCDSRPLHVLASDDTDLETTVVITVYEPDPTRWEPGFRRRR